MLDSALRWLMGLLRPVQIHDVRCSCWCATSLVSSKNRPGGPQASNVLPNGRTSRTDFLPTCGLLRDLYFFHAYFETPNFEDLRESPKKRKTKSDVHHIVARYS